MTLLVSRTTMLILFAAILFLVKKKRPASWMKVLSAIIVVPLLCTILDFLFQIVMELFRIEDGIITCAIYTFIIIYMELSTILGCLFIYKSFCNSSDDVFKIFAFQPMWTNITLLVLIILICAFRFYDNLTIARLFQSNTSYEDLFYTSPLGILTTLSPRSLLITLCSLMRAAIVGVEAVVCGMKLSKSNTQ